MKCFKNNINVLDNPCQICGNNYSKLSKDNIGYIDCYEYKEIDIFSPRNIQKLLQLI